MIRSRTPCRSLSGPSGLVMVLLLGLIFRFGLHSLLGSTTLPWLEFGLTLSLRLDLYLYSIWLEVCLSFLDLSKSELQTMRLNTNRLLTTSCTRPIQ